MGWNTSGDRRQSRRSRFHLANIRRPERLTQACPTPALANHRAVDKPEGIGNELLSPLLDAGSDRAAAVYARAKAAGAEIVIEIEDEDYGGRVFSCRDLEGHLWNVDTYDPW